MSNLFQHRAKQIRLFVSERVIPHHHTVTNRTQRKLYTNYYNKEVTTNAHNSHKSK